MAKRIGYLVPEFPGQTHNFFWREVAILRQLGIEVDLISTRLPSRVLMTTSWGLEANARTTYLHPLSIPDLGSAAVWVLGWLLSCRSNLWAYLGDGLKGGMGRLARQLGLLVYGAKLAAHCRKAGIRHVHVHSCADSMTVALIARYLQGCTYGVTLHNPLWVYGPGQPTKWSNASYAIVITQSLLADVRRELRSALPPLMGVAPMGVDCLIFRRRQPYVAYRNAGPLQVVCCARLNVAKGIVELITSIRLLVQQGLDVQLTIAGEDDSGGTGFRKVVEAHVTRTGMQSRVTLLGAVSEQRVIELLQDAHVFGLASYEEPLGVSVMEAMSMEMPVVVTWSPGISELVEHETHGLVVPPQDEAKFAEALHRIAQDPQLAATLGRNGRQRVEEHFSVRRSAELIATFLAEIELRDPTTQSANHAVAALQDLRK